MVTILGLGFTGRRLAARLLAEGQRVAAVVRDPARFGSLETAGLELYEWGSAFRIPGKCRIFYSIPPLNSDEDTAVFEELSALLPERVVYVSSTGVYGRALEVDEVSSAEPADDKGHARLAAELRLSGGPWSTLVLRAAAIYGPHRGIHVAIREGRLPRGAGTGVVSRVHVDDLVSLAAVALDSTLEGSWPVADQAPCAGALIAAWLAGTGGGTDPSDLREFPVSGRRVHGAKIFDLLKVKPRFPTWREGIRACIAEEAEEAEVKA